MIMFRMIRYSKGGGGGGVTSEKSERAIMLYAHWWLLLYNSWLVKRVIMASHTNYLTPKRGSGCRRERSDHTAWQEINRGQWCQEREEEIT